MPLTQSWADLGFDVPDAPAPVPDAARTFDTLTEDEQRRVLGPTRYEAYKRGEYPIGDWAVTRQNDGWRKSVTTSPAPAGYEASAA